MKRTFAPLDEFVKAHTTQDIIKLVSGMLKDACSVFEMGKEDPSFALGAVGCYLADASHVMKLLDKQLSPKDDAPTVVA